MRRFQRISCPVCHSVGYVIDMSSQYETHKICPRCHGRGKIQIIVEKEVKSNATEEGNIEKDDK